MILGNNAWAIKGTCVHFLERKLQIGLILVQGIDNEFCFFIRDF